MTLSDSNNFRNARIVQVIDTGGPGGAEQVTIRLACAGDARFGTAHTIVGREGWLSDQLRQSGVSVEAMNSHGHFAVGYLAKLIHRFRQPETRIAHAHLLGASVYSSLAGFITRLPVICTIHGPGDIPEKDRFRTFKTATLKADNTTLVAVSKSLQDELSRRMSIPAEKIHVIYNGVDTQQFSPGPLASIRQELGLQNDDIIVGALGNLRPAKDYPLLLRAAEKVVRKNRRVYFVIAGSGPDSDLGELERLKRELDISQHVFFVGHCDNSADFLNNIDIFAMSSKSEGLPVALLEALACGKPAVATDAGGTSEIVTNDAIGLVVPVGEHDPLAAQILALADNPDMRRSLGEAAVATVVSRFSLSEMEKQYFSLYAERAKRSL